MFGHFGTVLTFFLSPTILRFYIFFNHWLVKRSYSKIYFLFYLFSEANDAPGWWAYGSTPTPAPSQRADEQVAPVWDPHEAEELPASQLLTNLVRGSSVNDVTLVLLCAITVYNSQCRNSMHQFTAYIFGDCRQPSASLSTAFLSAILQICKWEMSVFLKPILKFMVFLVFLYVNLLYASQILESYLSHITRSTCISFVKIDRFSIE